MIDPLIRHQERLNKALSEANIRENYSRSSSSSVAIVDWEPYIRHSQIEAPTVKTWGDVVPEFSERYRTKHDLKDKTWKNSYHEYLRRIPADAPISGESLLKLVEDIAPSYKRSLQIAIQCLGTLAKFAKVEANFEPYKVRRRS